jgi:class III poly(R)-hydroxyalkanoic acid synthase PhaC subunit
MAVLNNDRAGEPHTDADLPPVTPFEIAYEGELLRLRRYRAVTGPSGPPVLLVSSFFKRPYVLDLVPDRSVVQNFLRQGFSVYLADWSPPSTEHAERGLNDYVEGELVNAVEHMRRLEGVDRIALVGCCLGGFVAAVYAALRPKSVERFVVFALPFDSKPPFAPAVAEYVTGVYGNVPAWWIRMGLNARVADRRDLPNYLAAELVEPKLALSSEAAPLKRALEAWFASDVPFAGRLFRDVMGDAYGRGQFVADRLMVSDRRVALDQIRCPVLNVCGARDMLVPVNESLRFVRRVGSRQAANLIFDCGHLGLMLSRAAHDHLWPHVGRWLASDNRSAASAPGAGPMPEDPGQFAAG